MNASLVWDDDGLCLRLIAAPFRSTICHIEECADDCFELALYDWHGSEELHAICRDAAEARAVVAALLGVRGAVVPEWSLTPAPPP